MDDPRKIIHKSQWKNRGFIINGEKSIFLCNCDLSKVVQKTKYLQYIETDAKKSELGLI